MSLIFQTDSYKLSHFEQFPPEMDGMYSYLESRGGEHDYTVFFGLQYLLKEYLTKGVGWSDIELMHEVARQHGEPFNYSGWSHVYRDHGGKIMVRIRAVPEGMAVPNHNVLMDVESTCPQCYWIVTWIETMLMRVWYPITVCTQSHAIKQLIRGYLERSSDDPAGQLLFKLHDFGARGVSSHESAGIGGAAHLVNFMGTDTIEALLLAGRYYPPVPNPLIDPFPVYGYSIPAAEHSTITAWGREREEDAYRNMVNKFSKPGSLFACVSDSYDLWKALDMWREMKPLILEKGGTLVVRPDSGNPPWIVSETIRILDHAFGSVENSKGYRVLNNVRVIQGDGINRHSIHAILDTVTGNGYSADNIAFGMGGALLQQVNRDTQKFAYKCSSVHYKGAELWDPISKDPITDPGKRSKAGKQFLVRVDDRLETIGEEEMLLRRIFGKPIEILEPVFENGKLLRDVPFAEVRATADSKDAIHAR